MGGFFIAENLGGGSDFKGFQLCKRLLPAGVKTQSRRTWLMLVVSLSINRPVIFSAGNA